MKSATNKNVGKHQESQRTTGEQVRNWGVRKQYGSMQAKIESPSKERSPQAIVESASKRESTSSKRVSKQQESQQATRESASNF